MLEDLKKIITGLKYWNLRLKNPKVDENFQSRLITQKLAFICKSLGFQMKYSFNLYKSGPYCPALTRDYYQYSNFVVNLESDYIPTKKEKEIFEKVKDDLLSHPINIKHRSDLLEAVATIFFIKKYDSVDLDDDIFEKTKNEKPFLSDRIITIAINIVKQLLFKPEFLTDEIKEELEIWDNVDDSNFD